MRYFKDKEDMWVVEKVHYDKTGEDTARLVVFEIADAGARSVADIVEMPMERLAHEFPLFVDVIENFGGKINHVVDSEGRTLSFSEGHAPFTCMEIAVKRLVE